MSARLAARLEAVLEVDAAVTHASIVAAPVARNAAAGDGWTVVSDDFLAAVQEARTIIESLAIHHDTAAEASSSEIDQALNRDAARKLSDLVARLNPNKR